MALTMTPVAFDAPDTVVFPVVNKMYGYSKQTVYKVHFDGDNHVGDDVVLVSGPIDIDDLKAIIANYLTTEFSNLIRVSVYVAKNNKANYSEMYLGRFIQYLEGIAVKHNVGDRCSLSERIVVEEPTYRKEE